MGQARPDPHDPVDGGKATSLLGVSRELEADKGMYVQSMAAPFSRLDGEGPDRRCVIQHQAFRIPFRRDLEMLAGYRNLHESADISAVDLRLGFRVKSGNQFTQARCADADFDRRGFVDLHLLWNSGCNVAFPQLLNLILYPGLDLVVARGGLVVSLRQQRATIGLQPRAGHDVATHRSRRRDSAVDGDGFQGSCMS